MPGFTHEDLAAWSGGLWTAYPQATVSGFAIDTRKLGRGDCFIAVAGARDGHDFLGAAEAAGASCALVSRHIPGSMLPQLVVDDTVRALGRIAAAWRRTWDIAVIGVTGSCGKTSTKDLLRQLLGADQTWATPGNLNNHLGVPMTLLACDPTRVRHAVVEAGTSGPGEIAWLAALIRPDIAVVTAVAEAHLEGLSDLEGVAREKAELIREPAPGCLGVFPSSLLAYEAFRDLPDALPVAIDAEPAPDGAARARLEFDDAGCLMALAQPGFPAAFFRVPLSSRGQASNAALAICVARRLGVDDTTISARLSGWRPSDRRGEFVTSGGLDCYIDCYNANPASLVDAAEAFARLAPAGKPRLYVIGSMGELGPDSAALHRRAASRLRLRPGDEAWLVGPDAEALRQGFIDAGVPSGCITLFANASDAGGLPAGFRGCVFLKGSRFVRLETLLPEPFLRKPGNPC